MRWVATVLFSVAGHGGTVAAAKQVSTSQVMECKKSIISPINIWSCDLVEACSLYNCLQVFRDGQNSDTFPNQQLTVFWKFSDTFLTLFGNLWEPHQQRVPRRETWRNGRRTKRERRSFVACGLAASRCVRKTASAVNKKQVQARILPAGRWP